MRPNHMFEPRYTITSAMLNELSEIAEIKAMVKRASLLPQREVLLRRWATIKIAHSSTSIEGNTLREHQVAQVSEGKKIIAETQQINEVRNYLEALRLIDTMAKEKNAIVMSDVIRLHRVVMKDLLERKKIGIFRSGPVYIVNTDNDRSEKVMYTAPIASAVAGLMNELLQWLMYSQEHPIVRAGLFHYLFETIHPFSDGNGRTGRLLTVLHLYQSGWDFRHMLVLEDYYNTNRERYFSKLQTGVTFESRQKADLTEWLAYFLEGFLAEAVKVKEQILSLQGVGSPQKSPPRLTNDELRIIDFALTLGKVTSRDVVDMVQIPKRTAQAKLQKLVGSGILRVHRSGPTTYYTVRMK